MAFKARDGLPKVQLDRMTKSQLVATVKKLQKRETALLNQVAKLQEREAQTAAGLTRSQLVATVKNLIDQPNPPTPFPWEKT